MAKIVLAGRSDCPYYAKCERLGDRLSKNLQKFKLHKIIVQPDKWDKWLKDTCVERGWTYSKSPIIWRELIDRGGKGVLIGDANDFQEYCKAYYDVDSTMTSSDMNIIASENKITKNIVDIEERAYNALSHPAHICITNATNPISYHLINSISSGQILGPKTEVTIRLLVTSAKDIDRAKGYAMEAEDTAQGVLRSINICTSPHEAFEDCSIIIMLDNIAKLSQETEKDWLIKNAEFFSRYACIINHKALKTCKIMLCGEGPLNFIAMIMAQNAPGIGRKNIVAVSAVVENQAKSVIGERLNVNPADVVNLIVWGNIRQNRLLDLTHCRVYRYNGAVRGPPWHSVDSTSVIHNNRFVEIQLPKLVATRHQKVSEAMGAPTSLSVAAAIHTTLKHWVNGCPSEHIFSMVVCSEGWFGVPVGMFFSFPVRMEPKGSWTAVTDLDITKPTKLGIAAAIKEIKAQKMAYNGGTDTSAVSTTKIVGTDQNVTSNSETMPQVG